MKRICVYCGSNKGANGAFTKAAIALGSLLAREGLGLVYGAGNVGLMGILADSCLGAGGEVIGVIPESLEKKELAHRSLTELIVVQSMHERKQIMADRADAFIALPGGIGTLEEVIEAFTWLQLNFHEKPIGLLNTAGYYDKLLEFLGDMCDEKFLKPAQREMLLVDESPKQLLQKLRDFKPLYADKWFEKRGGT
jgi:uncharacterized protein (TIGR00730 family)